MQGLLSAGGDVFFLGENGCYFSANDTLINGALTALGSTLSLQASTCEDGGFHVATGAHIAANPLTAGVNSFVYAFVADVTGGTPLFYTSAGNPFVEVERTATTPEPASLIFLFTAVAGLAFLAYKRRRALAEQAE